MQEYHSALQAASIFDGVAAAEIDLLLDCFGARVERYEKDEFVLRAGDCPQGMGLVVCGSILIVQEDFWGRRNLMARIMRGHLARCAAHSAQLPPQLSVSQPNAAQSPLGSCREKPAQQ